MYFWLKEGAEEELRRLENRGLLKMFIMVKDNVTGRQCVRAPVMTIGESPTELTNALERLAERVTVSAIINRTSHPDGEYRHGDAYLVVITTSPTTQAIGIRGPTVVSINDAHKHFMDGKLVPTVKLRGEQDIAAKNAPSSQSVH